MPFRQELEIATGADPRGVEEYIPAGHDQPLGATEWQVGKRRFIWLNSD